MSEASTRARRRLIVPRSNQRRWFLVITLILLVLLLVSGGLFYAFAQQRLEAEYFKAHSQIRNVMDMLLPWMIGVYLAGLLLASWLTLLVSRRFAGPLVGIRRQLRGVEAGDAETRLVLRRGDEYRDLAEDINGVLERKGALIRELRQHAEEMRAAMEFLHRQEQGMPAPASPMDNLRASLARLCNVLGVRA